MSNTNTYYMQNIKNAEVHVHYTNVLRNNASLLILHALSQYLPQKEEKLQEQKKLDRIKFEKSTSDKKK